MASRDHFPNKSLESVEDSKNRKNNDRYYRGYSRRNNYYSNHEVSNRDFDYKNRYKENGKSFHNFQNVTYSKDFNDKHTNSEALSWRKSRNIESLINQRESLVTQITQRQYECMICCSHIELQIPIWSCENCYHIFHIDCIRKWSKTCGDENGNTSWRCPACQNPYSIFAQDLFYQCYCGKQKNPFYNRSLIPHSCGDVCGKKHKTSGRCPHSCILLCHPGPCPICEASIKSNCHCGKVEFIVKCTASDSNLSCGSKCEKRLNCSIHICHEICHVTSCAQCQEIILQKCCCGQTERSILCGSKESYQSFYTCDNVCKKLMDCGEHSCEDRCHPGQCQSCRWLPENTRMCPCGKTPLAELCSSGSLSGDRARCVDPVPTCSKVCERQYAFCEHRCSVVCHEGQCPACPLTADVKCRCGKTSQNMRCGEVARVLAAGDSVRCTTRCKAKKQCGLHRCQELCCDQTVHLCGQTCGKSLSCRRHVCQWPCHKGLCVPCDEVSFDELSCECGLTRMLPPVPCGQEPPPCVHRCRRATHPCDHEVTHSCHTEPVCPPCTVLTSKQCPGKHKTLDNIPCFRPVVTCGLQCQRPLPDCGHRCPRICHEGPCRTDPVATRCQQPCGRPRPDCGHPCNRPCHEDLCQDQTAVRGAQLSCQTTVDIHCPCSLRTTDLSCDRLHRLTALLLHTSDQSPHKRDVADLFIKDGTVYLSCDNDCRKAARTKQLTEAFESESFSLDRAVYSSFLRDFAVKNTEFLVHMDSALCGLIRRLDAEKLKKTVQRFDSMSRDKRRFIQELSECFLLSTSITDADSKCVIVVEAVKGICKIPSNRLIHFIQKNYPQLFKTDKPTSLKNVKIPPVSINDLSFIGRMKSINDLNKS